MDIKTKQDLYAFIESSTDNELLEIAVQTGEFTDKDDAAAYFYETSDEERDECRMRTELECFIEGFVFAHIR